MTDSGKKRSITIDVGPTRVTKLGVADLRWSDLYHVILSMPWPAFFLAAVCVYLIVNVVFAFAYYVGGGVSNATTFLDYFFFSIQTLATVGYGNMSPASTYAHWIATAEIITGLLTIAIMTSLVFARFSKPTARIMFSKVAVIVPYNGTPTLMVRVANQRGSYILEAMASIALVRSERAIEGHELRRFYKLSLERTRSPLFALTWLLMHRIDETSPLHGLTAADIRADDMRLVTTLSGMDETFAANVTARHHYTHESILFDHRFVDMFSEQGSARVLHEDMAKFHLVERFGR
ncbi:MAG TPA: ion channel [Rhodanobacteraceae bacterium]|nr:ion channel [Rhodanobacteraceae bacterium]